MGFRRIFIGFHGISSDFHRISWDFVGFSSDFMGFRRRIPDSLTQDSDGKLLGVGKYLDQSNFCRILDIPIPSAFQKLSVRILRQRIRSLLMPSGRIYQVRSDPVSERLPWGSVFLSHPSICFLPVSLFSSISLLISTSTKKTKFLPNFWFFYDIERFLLSLSLSHARLD